MQQKYTLSGEQHESPHPERILVNVRETDMAASEICVPDDLPEMAGNALVMMLLQKS